MFAFPFQRAVSFLVSMHLIYNGSSRAIYNGLQLYHPVSYTFIKVQRSFRLELNKFLHVLAIIAMFAVLNYKKVYKTVELGR